MLYVLFLRSRKTNGKYCNKNEKNSQRYQEKDIKTLGRIF